MVCHELAAWQAVTGGRVVYLLAIEELSGPAVLGVGTAEPHVSTESSDQPAPAASVGSRADRPVALYRAAGPAGKAGRSAVAPRRRPRRLRTRPGDASARVPARAARAASSGGTPCSTSSGRSTRRSSRSGSRRLVVERAATWVPAPCWAVVSSDGSGQLSVLAERGLESEMGPAVFGIAGWVMQRGEEFVTADLQKDAARAGRVRSRPSWPFR